MIQGSLIRFFLALAAAISHARSPSLVPCIRCRLVITRRSPRDIGFVIVQSTIHACEIGRAALLAKTAYLFIRAKLLLVRAKVRFGPSTHHAGARWRVGLNLKRFRAERGLSQEELAFGCGLHLDLSIKARPLISSNQPVLRVVAMSRPSAPLQYSPTRRWSGCALRVRRR